MLPAGTANPNPDTSTANGANFTEGTSPDGFDNTTAASTGNTTDAISGGGSKGEANTTAAGNAANNTGSSGNPNTAIPSPAPTTDVIGGGNIAGTNSGAGQLTGTVDPIPGSATGGIGIAGLMHVGSCQCVVPDMVTVLLSDCQFSAVSGVTAQVALGCMQQLHRLDWPTHRLHSVCACCPAAALDSSGARRLLRDTSTGVCRPDG